MAWPLLYAAARPRGGRPRGGGEVWAPPGNYTVTLTVDGKALSRTLTLVPDPRVKLDPSAYRDQFELARRIEATSARVAKAAAEADTLRRAVLDRRRDAKGDLAAALDKFQARLTDLSGLPPLRNPADAFAHPPRHIESLRWIAGALGDLQGMVNGADAAPSPDAREAFAKLEPMVESALAAWERFATDEFEALNGRLRAEGRKAIAVGP
jgi:hypothetical protein